MMEVQKLFYFSFLLVYNIQCIKLPMQLSDSFGPFKAEWSDFQQCSGPKRMDLTKSTANFVKVDNSYILYMNITFLEKAHVDHIKVDVYTVKNNVKNLLWRHKADDPCKYFALGEVLSKYFTVSKNCMVFKGEQQIVANMTDMAYAFYGKSFYYGEYVMKGAAFSDKGNLVCMSLNSIYRRL